MIAPILISCVVVHDGGSEVGGPAYAETLDEAGRKATRYMIDYLVAERGMDPTEAYALCSLAGDLQIAEVVDVPHVLVAMHMAKSIFR